MYEIMNPSDFRQHYLTGSDAPADTVSAPQEERQVDIIPIPDSNTPAILLPNPGEGGFIDAISDTEGNIPIIPPSNSGEGGYPSSGSLITVLPRPTSPCFFCNASSVGNVRFLNAATGYNPFRVSVNNRVILNTLDAAEISDYGRVSSGEQTITISGQNGYIYISKPVQIEAGTKQTIAIVNTTGGLDLVSISDVSCNAPLPLSCLRACNLSYNSGPLNLSLSNGFILFRNISFMDVTGYNRLFTGNYDFFLSRQGRVLVSFDVNVRPNSLYTIYIFNWNNSPDAIRTMVLEDRK